MVIQKQVPEKFSGCRLYQAVGRTIATAIACTVAMASFGFSPNPASAYVDPAIIVSPAVINAGDTITISGTGLQGNIAIISISRGFYDNFIVPVDTQTGTLSFNVTVPSTVTPGAVTVNAVTGGVPPNYISTSFIVRGATDPPVGTDPAMPNPFTLDNIQVFTDIFTPGDRLLLFRYNIVQYPQEPAPMTTLFNFRLYNAANQSLGTANVYDYYDNGYGMGVGSIYFKPDIFLPSDSAELYLLMNGNPLFWRDSPPPSVLQVLTFEEYINTTGSQPLQLATWIMDMARVLEINWAIKMWETSNAGNAVLTLLGMEYFVHTIPGIRSAVPDIMPTAILTPDWGDGTPNWGLSAVNAWAKQWQDSAFMKWLERTGDAWGISPIAITSVMLFVLIVLCFGISHGRWGNTSPGLIAGWGIMLVGTFSGLMYPFIFGVVALFMAGWMGMNLFWKNG